MRQCHPGVQSPRSLCFDLRVRASTEQRLVLTWIYPAALFFLKIIVICSFTCLNALLGPISSWEPPTTTTDVPWWPEKKYINIYIK